MSGKKKIVGCHCCEPRTVVKTSELSKKNQKNEKQCNITLVTFRCFVSTPDFLELFVETSAENVSTSTGHVLLSALSAK